jgi:hypothetical protein
MRVRSLIGAIAAALGVLALALGASGCGSSTSAVLDPVAQAAAASSHAGGVHMSFTGRVSAAGLATPITLSGTGAFNYTAQEGSLGLDVSGLPATAGVPQGPLHVEELFKSATIFIASPLLSGHLPGGARWVKLDVAKSAAALGVNLQQLTAGQSNPAQFLEYLKAVAGTTTLVGHDVIRGVATNHYRGTIELRKVAGLVPPADRAAVSAGLSQLASHAGLSSVPVDVWVDAQRLVRRMQIELALHFNGQAVGFAISVDLFDYGATAPVTPPAPGEVFDATGTALNALANRGG